MLVADWLAEDGRIARCLPGFEPRPAASRDGGGRNPRVRGATAPGGRSRHGNREDVRVSAAGDRADSAAQAAGGGQHAHDRAPGAVDPQGRAVPANRTRRAVSGRTGQRPDQLRQSSPAKGRECEAACVVQQSARAERVCTGSKTGRTRPTTARSATCPRRRRSRFGRRSAASTTTAWGGSCPTYNQCFYYRARRRAETADLLIVNHALLIADLLLRRENASVLPDHDLVIIDEAHTLEAVASDQLGVSVSSAKCSICWAACSMNGPARATWRAWAMMVSVRRSSRRRQHARSSSETWRIGSARAGVRMAGWWRRRTCGTRSRRRWRRWRAGWSR